MVQSSGHLATERPLKKMKVFDKLNELKKAKHQAQFGKMGVDY